MPEQAVFRRQWRLDFFQWTCALVGSFLLAAEDHRDPSLRIELDHHVGAFVSDPDVVLGVDFDAVGIGPGVEVVADLTQKLAIGIEFQKLCGGRAVRRPDGIADARENEDVFFGIHGDAGNLAEIYVGRKLQEVRYCVVRDLRHSGLLCAHQNTA